MKCEYCDSNIAQAPDNGICPNCGGPMGIDEKSGKRKFPDPPLGLYMDDLGDYVEIKESSMKLYKSNHIVRDASKEILYEQICAVEIKLGSGVKPGFLCVRELQNREISMPTAFMQALRDENAVTFIASNTEKFYLVYTFLKECAEIVNGE